MKHPVYIAVALLLVKAVGSAQTAKKAKVLTIGQSSGRHDVVDVSTAK